MTVYPIDTLQHVAMIHVGRQTEAGVERIGFDCSDWLARWPGMELSVWVTAPGADTAYEAQTHMDGNVIVWDVSGSDTITPGKGYVEMLGMADGRRKLSARVQTKVVASGLSATADPPESQQPWFERAMEAVKGVPEVVAKELSKAIDPTLSIAGMAADARATGVEIAALSEEIENKGNPTDEQVSAAVNAYLGANPIPGQFVTPEMFGAKGDGSANDDTAIQTALNQGGLVVFPGTQYKIGTNITIPSNTYLLGYGARITPYNYKGKLITSSNEAAENIHVDGLVFDGYITTIYNRDPAHGLQFNGVANCTVENCVFSENNDGIYIAYSANQRNEVKVRNCKFINFMRQGITLIHGEAVIECCTFTRNEEKGINAIDLEPNNTYEIPKAVVRNCVFTNCSIYANRKDTVENREHIDLEITVENCNITSGNKIGCVDVSFAKKAHIKNCILNDVADRHDNIYSSGVMFYRVLDASVENCVITSTSASAISGADSHLYISDCDITPDHYGIVSIGNRCDVMNTSVKSSGDWSLIFQTQVRKGVVSGCDFGNGVTIGEGSNAEIGYPANVRFAFNTIIAPEENAKEYGLLIAADDSTFVYNRISGFATSIADSSVYVGTGNIVEPNAIDTVDEQAV